MFSFLKKGHEPKIEFISLVEGLDQVHGVQPRPAIEFLPDWWKSLPKYHDPVNKDTVTAKGCPSFPHYFNSGYIIPMWQDTTFVYSEELNQWYTKAGREDLWPWEHHPSWQLLDYTNTPFQGQEPNFIFKANNPWNVITPKGWSVLQLPLFYHFKNDYTILPGIIDTDLHHQINQQVAYFGNGKEVTIKRGEPFVQLIPFQRDSKLEVEIRSATQTDKLKIRAANLHLLTKQAGTSEYKHMRHYS